jgi:quinol monooxygenase YgiN
MRAFVRAMLLVVLACTLPLPAAHAQGGMVYLVGYVEVRPDAADAAARLLARHGSESRAAGGNLRFDVLREIGRPERFAVVEAWKDQAAVDEHGRAAGTLRLRDDLAAITDAPWDKRGAIGLAVGPTGDKDAAGAVYVLTHVDVVPKFRDDTLALLKGLRTDATGEPGNLNYEIWQQANRANHFTVVEEWANDKAVDDHVTAPHTRKFREALVPMQGALYDERRYRAAR